LPFIADALDATPEHCRPTWQKNERQKNGRRAERIEKIRAHVRHPRITLSWTAKACQTDFSLASLSFMEQEKEMIHFFRAAVCSVLVLVGQAAAEEIRIGTWNLEWFNDDDASDDRSEIGPSMKALSRDEYLSRVHGIAAAIAELRPQVMALEEIENARVVHDLAERLDERHGLRYQVAFVQGTDTYTGQDVAALVQQGIEFSASRFRYTFGGDSSYKSLSKHLRIRATLGGERFEIVAVHLITQPADRIKQARTLRAWTRDLVDENLVILGDLNASLAFNETTPNSDIGIIRGFGTPSRADDLFDAHERLANRRTHVSGRELDRVLLSPSLVDTTGLTLNTVTTRRDLAIRGEVDRLDRVDYSQPDAEQDLSDHFPLLITLDDAMH
jgi:endonuclease/exonuclease/phosphatase family metal-dependent hydrolase